MATSPIDQIRSAVDEFGVTTAICYLADQALARLGGRFRVCDYDIMVQPIADSDKAPANLTKSFTIREIEEGDPLVAQMPPPPAIIEARYRQDYVCIGGFQKDDFIGYQWFAFGPYEEDEVRCQFLPTPKETAVFDFDFYLLPEHRLGLGFVAMWDRANAMLRDRGIRYTTSRVSRFNSASRKSHAHFGWRRIGRLVFVAGKRWQFMLGTLAPYLHFSFSADNRPRIRVDTHLGA